MRLVGGLSLSGSYEDITWMKKARKVGREDIGRRDVRFGRGEDKEGGRMAREKEQKLGQHAEQDLGM